MAFLKENEYWKLRKKHGKPKKFTPDELWKRAQEYFEFIRETPLKESVVHGKDSKIIEMPKMRAMTFIGLSVYIGIASDNLREYEKDDDYHPIFTRIRDIIRTQKFEGAAAGLLNHAIIARDLQLADIKKIDVKGNLSHLTDEQLEVEKERLREKEKNE